MARFGFLIALCLSVVQISVAHGIHEHESNETPQEKKTNVNLKVPNFLNMLPDFDKIFGDFDFGSEGESDGDRGEVKDTPIRKHMKNIRENVRNVVQSALNLQGNETDLFNLEMSSKGPKTSLNINSPVGQLSLDAKARPKEVIPEEITKRVSPKPFNELMSDMIKDQANRLDEFTLNILGPRDQDGNARNILSLSNQKDKTNLNFRSPIYPVKLNVASQSDFSSRSGSNPPTDNRFGGVDSLEDNWDPEDEYNQHIDHQKQKYFQMRSHESGHRSEQTGAPLLQKRHPHYPVDPHHYGPYNHPHGHYDDIHGLGVYPGVHVHRYDPMIPNPHVMPIWPVNQFVHREGHLGVARRQPNPASNLPIQNYHDHRYMAPNLDYAEQMMQSYATESPKPVEDEQENYEEYIRDLEEATNSIDEETKEKLKAAYAEFKASVDQGEPEEETDVGLETDQKSNEWLPRRIVDQRDLELAFLNIDKDSKERPNPKDKVVVAFTLTGEPLKIYIDSAIENPISFLNDALEEAGITLNIPVSSYETMEPVGEVLYVGAGNKGNEVSEAVSLEVQNVEDIKKSVRKFLQKGKAVEPGTNSSQALVDALHDVLNSGSLTFSDALEENFQRNPIQVLADITTFLSSSPQENKTSEIEG